MVDMDTVSQWLIDGKCSVEVVPPSSDEVLWQVLTNFPGGTNRSVILSTAPNGNFIQIQRGINVVDEHRVRLRGLGRGAANKFKYELFRDLSLGPAGVLFNLTVEPPHGTLTRVDLAARIWEEALSRQKFFEMLSAVHNLAQATVVHVHMAIGENIG